MKVKIGDKIYDSDIEPIMVVLTPRDKELISDMEPVATRYCCYPETMTEEEVKQFMKIPYGGRCD